MLRRSALLRTRPFRLPHPPSRTCKRRRVRWACNSLLCATTDSDLETAFATFSQHHVGAVLVSDSTFYNRRTEKLAALAARHALPAIFSFREFALAGGLMS